MNLSIAKDIRAELNSVRHQGRRPTCLAFAASDVHRHARKHPEYLCVEWLYYHATQQAKTGPHAGTTIPDTRAVLKGLGQPVESIWPYSSAPPNPTTWRPPAASGELMTCASSEHGTGLQAVRQNIDQGMPVVIGLFVSDTFNFSQTWDYSGDDVILARDADQPIDHTRGHAVVVVGRGGYHGEPVMLLRNSWGPNWGHQGHAWVRETYLHARLAGAFVVTKGEANVL
jgi:hypothetical protein